MRFAAPSIFGLCLAAIFIVEATGEICQLPKDGKSIPVPDIFALTESSYSFIVEANYNHLGKTHYITEYYDRVNMSGRLEIEKEGTKTTVVYFSKTNEFFQTDPYKTAPSSCNSQYLTDLSSKEFEDKFTAFGWINVDPLETIVGPSNIFRTAYLTTKLNSEAVVQEAKQGEVRGMKVNVWTWCKGEMKIRMSFTDPTQEQPMGFRDIPVPVEVSAVGTWEGQEISEYFEFVGMRLDIPQRELDLTISIPVTVGCERLAENLKELPAPSTKGMDFKAEMVYTPFLNNSPSFSYTNNFKLAYDVKSKMLYVEFAPWRKHKEDEMAKPGHDTARVIDIENDFVFDMDKSDGTCRVYKKDDNYDKFNLPDGFEIYMEDDDLFFLGSNPRNYHYLGETIERGIPASVFELVIESNDTMSLDKTIVTRYQTSDTIQVDNIFTEKNAPLKTILWKIALEDSQFVGRLEMNMYDYVDQVPKKHQRFDVTSCFTGREKSKWFQIVFPLDDHQMKDILPHMASLANDYTPVVDHFGEDVPPYRIPKLMADIDKDNIYLTGLILERPDFLLDFVSTNKTGFRKMQPMGVTTLNGCAKSCLENPVCTSFSYCGALCTISEQSFELEDLVQNTDCTLYISLLPEGSLAPTMDEVTRAIARRVEEGSFPLQLNIPGEKPQVIEITASLFRDNIAYGLNGLEEQPEGTAEDRFSSYKPGYKMDTSMADEGRSVNRMSFGSCQQACADKESCQSFSFCQATLECMLSTKHGEEIPDDKMVASSQCTTLSRNYRDYFNEYPGLSLNHDAEKMVKAGSVESCAKACYELKDFTCKSFDFCPSASGDGIEACWLHKEHFSDIKEASHLKVDEQCGHYSRKYLMEFKQSWHKDMSGAESGAVIANVTADDCSRYCKENQGFYCQGFDHCFDPFSSSSVCTLRKSIPESMTDRSTCNAYIREGSKAPNKQVGGEEGHSKSATGGLGFLMLLIGLALGIGAIYGYGYWKANRKS